MVSCTTTEQKKSSSEEFNYVVDRFADFQILRYEVKDFDSLSLEQKELIYYLSEAALWGRDIYYDQNSRVNLAVKRTLESIYTNFNGDKNSDNFKALETYLKQVWAANGIHHDYSSDKLQPHFSQPFFEAELAKIDLNAIGTTADVVVTAIFDPNFMPKRVNQAAGEDLLTTSAMNYYSGVTEKEAEEFYNKMKNPNDQTPPSYGLNSRLVKRDGKIYEEVWKVGGRYSEALEKVVFWLEKAEKVAENETQRSSIESLINYYKSGDLKIFDEYTIKWVQDTASVVDFVNGFTESYGDPLGMKASWESIVNFKNIEATKHTSVISDNAQWFEDNSPIDNRFKKEEVKGVSAKVITAAMLGGDCYPATPIGINLPNSNWVRRDHGSKSVTITNITEAYDKASQGSGFAEEFMIGQTEIDMSQKYGSMTDNLHTDLHECLGHGSGKILPGVDSEALKAYGAPLEEARADLFALYYMADPKMVELGLLPDSGAYKAEFYKYIMNGAITQLTRIKPGKSIEQAHMRNRATIARWVLEKGADEKIVEMVVRDGKTYIAVNDYDKLRALFGTLLAEIQRIKSEGDFNAGKALIEKYGITVDSTLHAEVLERYNKLNLAPYKGFVNPIYEPVMDGDKIVDVKVRYDEDFVTQQLRYSKQYSTLPTDNK